MPVVNLTTTFTVGSGASENEKKLARDATRVTTQLRKIIEQQQSLIETLQADNAALDARVTALEP